MSKKSHRRNVLVFSTLLGSLGMTSVLLLALSPAPLTPDAAALLAVDGPAALGNLFDTPAPFRADRWKYVYVHHSRTEGGNIELLSRDPNGFADHFLIGNGSGKGDGEVEVGQRWRDQLPAMRDRAGNDQYISICVVGDFDRTGPSEHQLRQLEHLIQTLRGRCGIAAADVFLNPIPQSVAGVGQNFPAASFRQRLPR